MTYFPSRRPTGDNAGTSIDLVQRRRRRGVGDWMEDLDKELGTNFSGGRAAAGGAPAITDDGSGLVHEDTEVAEGFLTYVQPFPGICKPANKTTLVAVVDFQKQLNRVAQVKGFPKIAADGDLGPATLVLFRQVQGASGGQVMGDGSSCMGIGPDLIRIGQQVGALANSLGAPATVSGPAPVKAPSFVNPKTGVETKVPGLGGGLIDTIMGMSTPMQLTLVGLAIGIGYFTFFDKKKRR